MKEYIYFNYLYQCNCSFCSQHRNPAWCSLVYIEAIHVIWKYIVSPKIFYINKVM